MKKLILNNWQAKLTSLVLAFALWYAIKQNVAANGDKPTRRPAATWQQE